MEDFKVVLPSRGGAGGRNIAASGAPTINVDPFSTEVLTDPYPFHYELREAGPVVWLEPHSVWATGRYEQVRGVLLDWQTFMSGAGVGLHDLRVEGSWRPPSLLLEADPPDHTVVREIIERVLSPRAVKILRDKFEARAEALVDRLISAGGFDAVSELAEVFPVQAFSDEVGIPEEGRENLLPYGNMVFNGFGPHNELFQAAMEKAGEVQEWIMASCRREALRPGGFGAQIYEAADAGELSEEQAGMLVRSFLSAGLDTTASSLGNAVYLLATNPHQWELLRGDPSLARAAFEETIRFETPVAAVLPHCDPRHRGRWRRDREGRPGDDLFRGGQPRSASLGATRPVRHHAQGVRAPGFRARDSRVRGQARGPHRGRGGTRDARS
jgi:cytochrome P450